MGETGPCGPCSEIHINLTDDLENGSLVNAGSPKCIEIWNLVFIQYNRDKDGVLCDLPSKHVDTGMGFERLCAVLQGKKSNYDSDVFTPYIESISAMSGVKYEDEINRISMRVIADHVRTLTFAIADGATPGNDGRGYVLRRILRRAARYGRKLGLTNPFLYQLVKIVVEYMSDVFPEIKTNQEHIEKIIKAEEDSFNVTLDRGIELFEKIAVKKEVRESKIISGNDVFMLYDTYGFPVDLTNVMAREAGLSIDEAGFNKLMDEQKARARESNKEKFASVSAISNDLSSFGITDNDEATQFAGYEQLSVFAKVVGAKINDDGKTLIIADRTPFYVEAGGQIDDLGTLGIANMDIEIVDVAKVGNKIIHIVENPQGIVFQRGMEISLKVDTVRRWDIMRNHSATHLMHAALRKVLGEHVHQSGSYVGPDRLRFDFAHYTKLSEEELLQIETIVNSQIRSNIELTHHLAIPFNEAKKMGALMFFGDKYGDRVNVVEFGDESREFCGGTHVSNTAQIGIFKIISESSIASGIRRIEAVTAKGVEQYIWLLNKTIRDEELKYSSLLDEKKKLEKNLAEIALKNKLGGLDSVLSVYTESSGVSVYKGKVEAANMDELKQMADELRNKIKEGVGVLFSEIEDKAGIVCVVSDGLIKEKRLSAGKIVGELAKLLGGGGGGRPHLATAGGKDISKIPDALEKVEDIIKSFL
jgi:alanyl-tRNA synthetase